MTSQVISPAILEKTTETRPSKLVLPLSKSHIDLVGLFKKIFLSQCLVVRLAMGLSFLIKMLES